MEKFIVIKRNITGSTDIPVCVVNNWVFFFDTDRNVCATILFFYIQQSTQNKDFIINIFNPIKIYE